MNNFFAEYEQEMKIRNDLDAAKANGSEKDMKEADAALHSLWDSINAKGDVYTGIYRAYRESLDKGE